MLRQGWDKGHVLLESILAELATDTRLLVATEGHLWVQLVGAVDLHNPPHQHPILSNQTHRHENSPK